MDVPHIEGSGLVAPDGRCIENDSEKFLLEFLGDPAPDYDAKLFAVKNLGFVYYRRGEAQLEVVVHPGIAAWPAVDR